MFKPLRDKILELAITGKLVPQLDSEPAVEQIGPAPAKDEEPFALPEKWKWVRFKFTVDCLDYKRVPVKQADRDKQAKIYDYYGATGVIDKVADFIFDGRFLLIGEDGANLISKVKNNAFIANGKYWVNNHAHVFADNGVASLDYLAHFINAISLEPYLTYSAQPKLTQGKLLSIFVPLPPLEEQRRIVAKLDDIMGNLERMDQAYTELSGPMLKHFKNLVLQQAISGQLVPQLDSEPAVEQLGPAHKPEEVPFAIPEKWKWVALEDLFQFVDYRGKTPIKSASGVRLITSSNVRKGYLDHTRCEYISIDEYQSRQSRGVSHKGDILFTTEAPLGNVALADLDVFSVGQRVITLKSKGLALNECFVWFLLSNYFQTEILKQATGSTVQGIKAARLKKLVLPLPPIEEQKRIAARINKLFAEADKLLEWQQFA